MFRPGDKSQQTQSAPVIDKLIHFVWAGGRMMGDDKQEVVLKWANANPGYEVNIWIDSKTTSKEDLDSFLREILGKSQCRNIKLRDIVAENLDDEYVRYEIDGTRKNYGGSSDKLRYTILYQNGGLYVDADVLPVGSLPDIIHAPHGALFAPHSQGIRTIGNDTLLAVRGSEIFRDLAQLARESYDKSHHDWQNKKDLTISSIEGYPASYDVLYALESSYVKGSITLDRTGPALVRNYLRSKGIIRPYDVLSKEGEVPVNVAAIVLLDKDYEIDPTYLVEGKYFAAIELVSGNKNTLGWMNTGIVDAPYETKLAMTLSSIIFEIEHMGILRLNEHIAALVYQKNGNGGVTEEKALQDLLSALDEKFESGEISAGKIQAYQIVPYMCQGSGEKFYLKYFQKDQSQQFSTHAKILENLILGKLDPEFKALRDEDACSLLQKIFHACGGVENIIRHPDERNMFFNFCKRILPKIDAYPKTINCLFEKAPDEMLAKLIKTQLRQIAANNLNIKDAKAKASAFICMIVGGMASNKQLINLLSEMQLNPLGDYNLLRMESDILRAKFGNTATWDKVIKAIKSKIIENITSNPEDHAMTDEEIKKLRGLLAIPSQRLLSRLFNDDDILAEFDRLTSNKGQSGIKNLPE
jgi:hypothetical protein